MRNLGFSLLTFPILEKVLRNLLKQNTQNRENWENEEAVGDTLINSQ